MLLPSLQRLCSKVKRDLRMVFGRFPDGTGGGNHEPQARSAWEGVVRPWIQFSWWLNQAVVTVWARMRMSKRRLQLRM
jgi:hypothetical protein